ncbi:MAG: ABC transporter substrate-binding protein [Candidatus Bipolaricaulota bacterium]
MLEIIRNTASQNSKWKKALLSTLLALALGAGASAFPIVVQDDRGEEIEIAEAPERVVVLAALYGEILVDLSAVELVVGVADSPDNPEELQGLPTVGPSFSPSVEAILGLEPDLVLGGWGDVRSGLERAQVPVLTAGQEGAIIAGVSDIFAAIRAVGEALGKSEEAARLIGDIALEIVLTESLVLGRTDVKVAFLYMAAPNSPPYANGKGTIEHELLLRAGGDNAFADVDGFSPVSLEEVLARDPDVIFTDPTQIDHILDSEHLEQITAVREGRVHGVRAAETTSTGVAQALREMARRLHPEAFEED